MLSFIEMSRKFFALLLPRDWRFLIRSSKVKKMLQFQSDTEVKKVIYKKNGVPRSMVKSSAKKEAKTPIVERKESEPLVKDAAVDEKLLKSFNDKKGKDLLFLLVVLIFLFSWLLV